MFGTTLDARGLRNPKALQVSLIVSRFPANPRRKVTTSFSVAVLCKDIKHKRERENFVKNAMRARSDFVRLSVKKVLLIKLLLRARRDTYTNRRLQFS